MTRVGFVAAWLIATGLATAFAWQVVGAANEQVSDAPLTPLIATATASAPSDTTSQVSTTSTTQSPAPSTTPATSTTTTAPGNTTTTPGNTTTTTSLGNTTTTTTTTSPGNTTVAPNRGATTVVSRGGTVSVKGSEPAVELVAVVAIPGWSYEVSTDDGTRVEVRFEHQSGERIHIRCRWTDGRLVGDIDD